MFDRKSGWPVVDGEPVKPYEIPTDPIREARAQGAWDDAAARSAETERTRWGRTLTAIGDGITARKGRGFEWTLFNRWTFEAHRVTTYSGDLHSRKYRVELYRRSRWNLNCEFWRSR